MSTIFIAGPSWTPVYLTQGDHWYVALPRGRHNPLMPAIDGKSMSVPQYCNKVSRQSGDRAFTRSLKAPETLRPASAHLRNFCLHPLVASGGMRVLRPGMPKCSIVST